MIAGTLEATTAARLQLVATRLMRMIRRHGAAGLSPSQVSALVTIEEGEPMRISTLATLEMLGAPAATRVVASLEEIGLLSREPDPDDGRAWRVALTAAGHDTLATLRAARSLGIEQRLATLTTAERRLLERSLPILEKLGRDA